MKLSNEFIDAMRPAVERQQRADGHAPKLLPRQKKPEDLEQSEQIEEVIRLRGAINDFLTAVDRGDFGHSLMVGPADEREESAFVTGLREVVGREIVSAI